MFPELIRRVYVGRWSGELLVERDDQKKKIYLDNGSISYCATNINAERLGSVLLRRGEIDGDTLRTALKQKGSMRLGEKLVADGVISEVELKKSLIESARENVYGMFNWDSGSFSFGPRRTSLPDDLQFQLPTSDVILEGVRRIEDFNVVEQGLGRLTGSLIIADDAPEASQTDSLTPVEGFLLSRIDGTLTLEEICAISTVDRKTTCRCLYGMYCAGLIKGDGPDPDAVQLPKSAEARQEQPAEPATAPPAPRPTGQDHGPVLDDEIERKHATCCVAQVDLYTVLEISNSSSEEQIRKAYYRLAKRYHPDRHRGRGGRDVETKLEALFMKIGEAYDTLHDSNKRFDYDQSIIKSPGRVDSMVLSDNATPDQVARMQFKEGMRFYLEKDFWNAVQLFRRAIEISPDENSEHYRYLALALSQNPKWGKEAERYFLKAINLEPFSPDLRLLLGRLYRQSGMTRRAEGQFEEALKLEPGNIAIQAELDDLRRGAEPIGGSFIKGLFRKNRKDS
jgi:curved DNA-binding protein CbpA